MNVFAEIERLCANFVERGFAQIFPSGLEPVQIARRLIAVFEATSPPPTRFTLNIHPVDYEALRSELPDLLASWVEMIAETADHVHVPLETTPTIEVTINARLVPGSVSITALPGIAIVRLRVTRGIPLGATLVINEPVTIGRGTECALCLVDPRISRRHATIARDGDTLVYTDAESTNGSFVAGRRVERAVLRRGDAIVLGDTELLVE